MLFCEDYLDIDFDIFLEIFARFHFSKVELIIKLNLRKLFNEINIVKVWTSLNFIGDFSIFESFDLSGIFRECNFGLNPFGGELIGIGGTDFRNEFEDTVFSEVIIKEELPMEIGPID